MHGILSEAKVEVTIKLVITEEEARALNMMTTYGADSFLKGYYKFLGRHYLQPFEGGIRSLFSSISKQLPPHLKRADKARAAFNSGD